MQPWSRNAEVADRPKPTCRCRPGPSTSWSRSRTAIGTAQEADWREARMSAESIYRLLLRAYPPDFRAEYEREMVLLFRDLCRESDVRTVGFWARVLCDVARSA